MRLQHLSTTAIKGINSYLSNDSNLRSKYISDINNYENAINKINISKNHESEFYDVLINLDIDKLNSIFLDESVTEKIYFKYYVFLLKIKDILFKIQKTSKEILPNQHSNINYKTLEIFINLTRKKEEIVDFGFDISEDGFNTYLTPKDLIEKINFIADLQESFISKNNFSSVFSKEIDDNRKNIIDVIKNESISDLKEYITKETRKIVTEESKEIKLISENLKSIHKDIADGLINSNFYKTSKRELRFAESFRLIGFLVLISTAIYVFNLTPPDISTVTDEKIKILTLAKPYLASFFGLIFSTIFFRESTKHRNQQHINEQMSFKVNILPSILEGVDEKDQLPIKHDVLKSIFSGDNKIIVHEENNSPVNSLVSVIQDLIKK